MAAAIRVLDFDGSIAKQNRLLDRYKADIIDFTDIAPEARFWLNRICREEIKKKIGASDRSAVTFLGSGDFHQVTEILISEFSDPMIVIDFDFHSDLTILAPPYTCGSWLKTTLKNKNILKCIITGVKITNTLSFTRHLFDKVLINEPGEGGVVGSFRDIIEKFSNKKAYITIDKDCLTSKYALTNWEEGKLSLEDLISMLKIAKDKLDVVGVDITGDYSDINIKGSIKGGISYLDHPGKFSARGVPAPEISRINEETNLRLMEALSAGT